MSEKRELTVFVDEDLKFEKNQQELFVQVLLNSNFRRKSHQAYEWVFRERLGKEHEE